LHATSATKEKALHTLRFIEFDETSQRVNITPKGSQEAEKIIGKAAATSI
jgi:hypothetical protein